MAKVHFVEKARKDNPVVQKGESYYWWQLYRGPKQYSKTKPKRSQLTGSSFLSNVYDIEDDSIPGICSIEDVQNVMDQIESLKDECQNNLDNLPEQFQEAGPGEILQNRIEACDSWISDIETIKEQYESEVDELDSNSEEYTEKIEEMVSEIEAIGYQGE